MITPRFKLSQDDDFLFINVHAPYCKLSDFCIHVEDSTFIFNCKPYYLRLNLPGAIEDDSESNGKYDVDSGEFNLKFAKVNKGEHFAELEFISKFLQTKVEVEDFGEGKSVDISIIESGREVVDGEQSGANLYGFAMLGDRKYKFNIVSDNFHDIFELNPFEIRDLSDRKRLILSREGEQFDFLHYQADYCDSGEIDEIISLKSIYSNFDKFSDSDLSFLKDLVNYEFRLNEQQVKYANFGLVDILFAYCYDKRSTHFDSEGTVESGWTINTLSATLSCHLAFNSLKEALISAFRRSLIYPLYRNFSLSQAVFRDVIKIIKLGKLCITKCLIDVHNIFISTGDNRYILNNLFIKDYIIYVMKWDKKMWKSMVVDQLNSDLIRKEDLGLKLCLIEPKGDGAVCKSLKIIENGPDSDDYSEFSDSSDCESD